FNVGNSIGAALGGLVIASGFGYMAPGWVAVGLASTGCVLALISVRLDKVRPRGEAAEQDAHVEITGPECSSRGSALISRIGVAEKHRLPPRRCIEPPTEARIDPF